MADKEIAGVRYKIGRLNAFDQLHVVRRLAPVLPSIMGVMAALSAVPEAERKPDGGAIDQAAEEIPAGVAEKLLEHAGPLTEAFARMTDSDVDYVVKCCLGAVEIAQGAGWSKMVTAPAVVGAHATRQLMFEELTLPTMAQLVAAVVQENMGDFFSSAVPSSRPGSGQAPATG